MTDKDYYVVQKGETLAGISKKLYGDTSHVKAICKMNGLSDGNLIFRLSHNMEIAILPAFHPSVILSTFLLILCTLVYHISHLWE